MPQWLNTELIRQLMAIFIPRPANFGVRVYRDSTQSISNAAWEAIEFNTERWDTGITNSYTNGFWDSGVNAYRLVATHAGFYCISGHAEFDSDANGFRGIAIALGATPTYIAMDTRDAVSTAGTKMSIATTYWLNVGDYVRLYVRQSSAGNLDILTGGNYSAEFGMVRIP